MQPKKRPSPRRLTGGPVTADKQGPRRPVGMQAMGPALYARIRQAVLEMGAPTGS